MCASPKNHKTSIIKRKWSEQPDFFVDIFCYKVTQMNSVDSMSVSCLSIYM